MTFKKLMMLAGIGGLVYAHRKRGGEMTLDSFKHSGRDLIDGLKSRAGEIRTQAETKLHEAVNKVADKTNLESGKFSANEDASFGSSGYDYGRNR